MLKLSELCDVLAIRACVESRLSFTIQEMMVVGKKGAQLMITSSGLSHTGLCSELWHLGETDNDHKHRPMT